MAEVERGVAPRGEKGWVGVAGLGAAAERALRAGMPARAEESSLPAPRGDDDPRGENLKHVFEVTKCINLSAWYITYWRSKMLKSTNLITY